MIIIRTKFLSNKQMFTAFVTFDGYDYQEYGETKASAIYFLKSRHPQLAHLPTD